MPVYEYKGVSYELPEGLSNEQALTKIKTHLGEAPTAAKATDTGDETSRLANRYPKPAPSVTEQMFGMGSPLYSFLRGAVVAPALGVNEMLSKLPIFPESIQRGASQNVQAERAAFEQAKKDVGRDGIDVFELIGAIASPANKALTGAKAATVAGRVGQGMAAGAANAAFTPTSGNEDDYVSEKLLQMGFGGVVGGAVPMTAATASKIKRIITELPISAEAKTNAMRKYVYSLIGGEDNAAAASAALKNAKEIVPGSQPTAAEALAETDFASKLIKEQGVLAKKQSDAFIKRAEEQATARQGELTRTFGTAEDLADLTAERASKTMPMKDLALKWADVYGNTAPKLVKAIEDATEDLKLFRPRGLEGEFTSKRAQNISEIISKNKAFKQAQLDSLNENGFYPLLVKPLIQRIDDSMSTVGERSNELLQNAQSSLKNKMLRLMDENGVIKSVDLYNVRKEIGDDIAGFLTAKGNPSFSVQASNVEKALKAQLDDMITKASGSDMWKQYLSQYAKYSEKINQMTVGQELQKKLGGSFDKESAGAFATGVQEAASLIKRTTGQNRYDKLEDLLDAKQMASVNRVMADLRRKELVASKGGATTRMEAEQGAKVPGFLSRVATLTREMVTALRVGNVKEMEAKLGQLMLDPAQFSAFLDSIPKKEAKTLGTVLAKALPPSSRQGFIDFMTVATPGEGEITRGVTQSILKD